MSDSVTLNSNGRWRWLLKRAVVPAVRLLLVGLLLGWLYGWASPRFYPEDRTVGFGHGFLHGALMPMALPSLLMGQNVEIFADDNSGRGYKIGYICGINVCGLVFFGLGFARPPKRVRKPAAGAETAANIEVAE